MKIIKTLLPYLLITVLCIGGVEYFYSYMEKTLQRPPAEEETVAMAASTAKSDAVSVKKRYDYQVIIDRNLFGGSLTAKEVPKEDVTSLDELDTTLLDIVLLGTVTGSKPERRAFILDKASNKQEIYQSGDAIQGAIIKEILRGKVILNFHGKDEILNMPTDKDRKSQGVAVTSSPRRQRTLSTPTRVVQPSARPERKLRTVRPTRKFSFKNKKTPEPPK